MRRLTPLLLTAGLLWAMLCSGCFDPPLAEIGFKLTNGGDVCNALVMVFNDQGRQIQQLGTDPLGVVYVSRLVPGTYVFKFQGMGGAMYPAVRTVTLGAGASSFLPVDVNQAKDEKGEAAATAMGGSNGDTAEHNEEP